MAKYVGELSFDLEESPDAEIMLMSMKSSLVTFFDLHPHFFKNVHVDLKKKEEKSAD